MPNNILIQNIFICNLDHTDKHIIREPKILPCGYKACFSCIRHQLRINGGFVKCSFPDCNQEHVINDARSLISDKTTQAALIENIDCLKSYVIEKAQQEYDILSDTIDRKQETIENYFSFIEDEIVLRTESLKTKLDELQENMINMLKTVQERFKAKFVSDFENIKMMYANLFNTETPACSSNSLYDFQDCLNELKHFEVNFLCQLKQFKFEPNNWSPYYTDIGRLDGDGVFYTITNKIEPKIINLDFCMTKVRGLCSLNNDKLLITDSADNKILIVDKNFRVLDKVNRIDKIPLKTPYGICYDPSLTTVMFEFSSYGHNRVLIFDEDLKKIKRIIGKMLPCKSHGNFDGPIDACFHSSCLYVLDQKNKRIQEFSKLGNYVREIHLYVDTDNRDLVAVNPTRLSVHNGLFCVLDSWNTIYVYDYIGELSHYIQEKNVNIQSLHLTGSNLYTLNSDGFLYCYDVVGNSLTKSFGRDVFCLKSMPSAFMSTFNGHLVVSLTNEKHLVVF